MISIVEGSNDLLDGEIEFQSAEVNVSVMGPRILIRVSEYPSVEAGDSTTFSAVVNNIGNIPSAFSMEVTQSAEVFTELSAVGEQTELSPGESRPFDFTLGADEGATPGIENFLVKFYATGQFCDEANTASDEPESVTVYILPSTGSGIGNSLPPFVLPLVFILLLIATTEE